MRSMRIFFSVLERALTRGGLQLSLFVLVPEGSPQNITSAAASATSLTFAWKPSTKDFANGVILGYHIILLDRLRNETRNITVQSLEQANIENLFPYTEYEARIVPFNSKGQGNASDVMLVRTKEAGKSVAGRAVIYFPDKLKVVHGPPNNDHNAKTYTYIKHKRTGLTTFSNTEKCSPVHLANF